MSLRIGSPPALPLQEQRSPNSPPKPKRSNVLMSPPGSRGGLPRAPAKGPVSNRRPFTAVVSKLPPFANMAAFSPPRTSAPREEKPTPPEARQLERELPHFDPHGSLSGEQKAVLHKGLEALRRIETPERRAKKTRKVHEAYAAEVMKARAKPVRSMKKALPAWAIKAQRAMRVVMDQCAHTGVFLNPLQTDHSHSFLRHCNPGADAIIIATHSHTRVLHAMVDGKLTTFFPPHITTPEQLQQFFDTADRLSPARNSLILYCNTSGPVPIYFQGAMANQEAQITTYYPIFHYGIYEAGGEHVITDTLRISSDDALAMAIAILGIYDGTGGRDPLQHVFMKDGVKRLVVDIAPLHGIDKGIFIEFPASLRR